MPSLLWLCCPQNFVPHPKESKIFWWSLYLFPLAWILLAITALLRFSFSYMVRDSHLDHCHHPQRESEREREERGRERERERGGGCRQTGGTIGCTVAAPVFQVPWLHGWCSGTCGSRMVSFAWWLLHGVFCMVSFAWCLLPGGFCLVPFAWCLLPGGFCMVSFAWWLLHGVFCLVSFAWWLLPGGFCLVSFAVCCLLFLWV